MKSPCIISSASRCWRVSMLCKQNSQELTAHLSKIEGCLPLLLYHYLSSLTKSSHHRGSLTGVSLIGVDINSCCRFVITSFFRKKFAPAHLSDMACDKLFWHAIYVLIQRLSSHSGAVKRYCSRMLTKAVMPTSLTESVAVRKNRN